MALITSAKTTVQFRCVFAQHIRHHQVWATKRKPKTSKDLALDYFDNVYGTLYGKMWPSIRLALLCQHKYCAVINNFTNTEEVSVELQNAGAINLRDMVGAHKSLFVQKIQSAKKKKTNIEANGDMLKKIEEIAVEKRHEELQSLYPRQTEHVLEDNFSFNSSKGEQRPSQEELIQLAKTPLEKGLLDANIDWNRQIDSSEGLSSTRINEFVPVSKLIGKEDFISEAEHFSFYKDPKDFPVIVEPEDDLHFPPHLQIYTYDPGNISRFQSPKPGLNGLSSYYLMDAGSILPVLTLDLRPGDRLLDMCSAPGGKSYVSLQTMYPVSLVCNDLSRSRLNRLYNVMNQYFDNWQDTVTLINGPGENIQHNNKYSKILVDVPCTNDRLSVNEDDNNIFTSSRSKERILLPAEQVTLLFKALQIVKVGGCVVYSTCSLNPAQNDGVVHMALRKIWEETSIKIIIKDLTKALEPLKIMFKFAEPGLLRYGSLVIPFLPSNFGPMYFCKLQRVE